MPTAKPPPSKHPEAKAPASPEADPLVGKPAPDVTLYDQDAKAFHLRDFRGKAVVLYFYPKDMTSGCTVQACEFQERLPDFQGLDAEVIGVSPDDAASHQKFRAKHDLQFTLAYDPSRKALEAFGVWKEKSMYGRSYMGVERSTFLIGPDGVVRGAWRKVKPEGDAARMLDALKGL